MLFPAGCTSTGHAQRDHTPTPHRGESHSWPLERGSVSALVWEAVPARTRGGVPVGAPIGGSQMVGGESGSRDQSITARSGGVDFFAPLITNETGVPLQVRIKAGLADAEECPCEVAVGATRAVIGYYRLFGNSTVEVRDAAGHANVTIASG